MKIKNRQQMLILLAGAVVALFAADSLVLAPLTKSWKTRSTRLVELRTKVDDGRRLLARAQSLQDRWKEMRDNTLPNNPSLAEQRVLEAFNRWAQRNRLTIVSLSPQWKHDADDYMTLECRVEATGSLDRVTPFLYDLEKDPMALKLQNVELSSRDNTGQQLALGLQVSGLVLTSQPQTR